MELIDKPDSIVRGYCSCDGCKGYNIHFCGVENKCPCLTIRQPVSCHTVSVQTTPCNTTLDHHDKSTSFEVLNNESRNSHPAYSCKNCEEQIYLFEEFENEEDENFTDYTGSFRSGNIRDFHSEEKLGEKIRKKTGEIFQNERSFSSDLETRFAMPSHNDYKSIKILDRYNQNRQKNFQKFYGTRHKLEENHHHSLPAMYVLNPWRGSRIKRFYVEDDQNIDFSKWNCKSMKILPTNRQMSRSKLCDLEVIDERGNFVATDGQDSRLHFYTYNGHQFSVRTPLTHSFGRGITKRYDGKSFAVCHLNKICVYSNSGDFESEFDMKNLSSCWGIAAGNQDNYVITDSKRGAVYITNNNFQVIKTIIGTQQQNETGMNDRKACAKKNEKTKQISSAGKSLVKYHQADIIQPRYVAVNSQDQILITDTELRRLIAINSDFTIAYSIEVGKTLCDRCWSQESSTSFVSTYEEDNVFEAIDSRMDDIKQINPASSSKQISGKSKQENKTMSMPRRKSFVQKCISSFSRLMSNKEINIMNGETHSTKTAFDYFENPNNGTEISFKGVNQRQKFKTPNKNKQLDLVDYEWRSGTKKQLQACVSCPADADWEHSSTSVNKMGQRSFQSSSARSKRFLSFETQSIFQVGSIGSDPRSSTSGSRLNEKSCANCKLGDPRGLCVDNHDNILVADKAGHRVLLYSKHGSLRRVLLSRVDDIEEPRQIKALNSRTLAVIDKSNFIKLFSFY